MKIKTIDAKETCLKEIDCAPVNKLSADVYKLRIDKLTSRMTENKISQVILYGDREHSANIEYFCGFDPRFEEALAVIDEKGKVTLIVGNEGWGYIEDIPFHVDAVRYQNFSLQGQPRDQSRSLEKIMKRIVGDSERTGVAGYKYEERAGDESDIRCISDIPSKILTSILKVCNHVCDFTQELIRVPDGIRMRLYCAEEIAWAESQANRCTGVIQRMIKNLRIGMKEYELPMEAKVGFDPRSMHPICNFGSTSVRIGLRSPGESVLQLGEVCGMCYGIKGNLVSRASIAAYGEDTCSDKLAGYLETFYYPYFLAVANWYETLGLGVTAGELYDSVMDLIGDPKFGVSLNPGHYIGTEEWSNASTKKGATEPVISGAHLQSDIIASSASPVMAAICEDGLVVADEELRKELQNKYPEVYNRIIGRQIFFREVLNIRIKDEILPLSNLNGVFFPFMLDTNKIFVK